MKIIESTQQHRLKKAILGAHPIIQHYLDKLQLQDLFRTYVKSDKRLAIPLEEGIGVLLHNLLTEPMPLYQMTEWLEPLDMDSLGLGAYAPTAFNDDRLGRMLDTLAKSNRKMIFFRLALRSIQLFELDCHHIHHDTTTVKLCGRYEGWDQEPQAHNGHSKDHRPDLKQLVLGVNMVGDGAVVIDHEIYSGNRTDDSVHISNWNRLRLLLQATAFIYTADSKLCTETNLRHLEFYGGQYITLMPRTWKEDALFRDRAREGKVTWRLILTRKNNRQPNTGVDKYYTTTTEYQGDTSRRILWIKSAQKAEHDQQRRAQQIEKTVTALNALNTKLNKYNLKRLPDIKNAVAAILMEHHTQDLISYALHRRTVTTKTFLKRGRPTAQTPTQRQRHTEYHLSYQINPEELLKQRRTDGLFPLLTNNQGKSAKDLLEIYKYQSFLENRHSQLKTELEVAPVFLKKPARILAFLDLVILALSIATLLERDLRQGMKRQGLKSMPLYPEERECQQPTAHSIMRAFQTVEKFELMDQDNNLIEYFPPKLTPLQKQILDLMKVPLSLYA